MKDSKNFLRLKKLNSFWHSQNTVKRIVGQSVD